MHRSNADAFSDRFDDVILDQDFDDWQADDVFEEAEADFEDEFDDIARDSHFLMRELDFAGDYDSL
jgi:hypothetical protein